MVFQQRGKVLKFQNRMTDREKRVKAVRIGGVTVSRRHVRFLDAAHCTKNLMRGHVFSWAFVL